MKHKSLGLALAFLLFSSSSFAGGGHLGLRFPLPIHLQGIELTSTDHSQLEGLTVPNSQHGMLGLRTNGCQTTTALTQGSMTRSTFNFLFSQKNTCAEILADVTTMIEIPFIEVKMELKEFKVLGKTVKTHVPVNVTSKKLEKSTKTLDPVRNVEFSILSGTASEFQASIPAGLSFEIIAYTEKGLELQMIQDQTSKAFIAEMTALVGSKLGMEARESKIVNDGFLHTQFMDFINGVFGNREELRNILIQMTVKNPIETLKQHAASEISTAIQEQHFFVDLQNEFKFMGNYPAKTFILRKATAVDGWELDYNSQMSALKTEL